MEMGAVVVVYLSRGNCDLQFDQSIGVVNNVGHLLWYKKGLHKKKTDLTFKVAA